MNRWAPRVAGPICMGRIMSTKVIETKCPGCGAMVRLDERQKQAFCNYCGSPVTVENTSERVTRKIDEAALKRAETEQLIRLKELELQERRERKAEGRKKAMGVASVPLVVVLLIAFAIGAAEPSGSPLSDSAYAAGSVCFLILAWGWLFTLMGNDKK